MFLKNCVLFFLYLSVFIDHFSSTFVICSTSFFSSPMKLGNSLMGMKTNNARTTETIYSFLCNYSPSYYKLWIDEEGSKLFSRLAFSGEEIQFEIISFFQSFINDSFQSQGCFLGTLFTLRQNNVLYSSSFFFVLCIIYHIFLYIVVIIIVVSHSVRMTSFICIMFVLLATFQYLVLRYLFQFLLVQKFFVIKYETVKTNQKIRKFG